MLHVMMIKHVQTLLEMSAKQDGIAHTPDVMLQLDR